LCSTSWAGSVNWSGLKTMMVSPGAERLVALA